MKILELVLPAALTVSFLTLSPAVAQQLPGGTTEGTSKIIGKIVSTDGSAIEGARVLAFHLSSETVYASDPAKGADFVVDNLPYGYFDLAVEMPNGLYVANQVVNLAPAGKAAIVFTVQPFAGSDPGMQREFPGSSLRSVGVAQVKEKPRGRDFWRSPRGIAIVAGTGGAALLAIAGSSDDDSSASPFVP